MAEPVLSVSRSGETVALEVVLPFVQTFAFRFHAGSEWSAKLLESATRARLGDLSEKVREQAYAQGWKDAKAKKSAKRTWFSAIWRLDENG